MSHLPHYVERRSAPPVLFRGFGKTCATRQPMGAPEKTTARILGGSVLLEKYSVTAQSFGGVTA
jgi:hypothetical protein